MPTYFYALHDTDPRGAIPIKAEEAQKWNYDGYGIFFAVQSLKSDERKYTNLDAVRCIAIDIDSKEQSKEEIIQKVTSAPLLPTLIVESKNGYHVYWILRRDCWVQADDPQEISMSYKAFLQERFIPRFGADKQACDVSRILRLPGFYHLKDPYYPFLVKAVFRSNKMYSIDELKQAFPIIKPMKRVPSIPRDTSWVFPEDLSIETIKKEVSILRVAEKIGIDLKPHGSIYKGRCPSSAHKRGDIKPSLCLYPDDGNTFNCFGCGVGGDVIRFYNTYVEDIGTHQTILKLKEMFR